MSAPLPQTSLPFLTALDPEMAVKGSLDPLGFLPIWSRYGRGVVGNLTSVTTSLRGFTTLLLGYWAAQTLARKHDAPERFLEFFLRVEQLAGYSRVAWQSEFEGDSPRILGIRRIEQRLHAGPAVPIGTARDAQILSNQKAYGLWGLFSVASESSGILDRSGPCLTDAAEEHVRRVLLPTMRGGKGRGDQLLLRLVASGTEFRPRGQDRELARCLAAAHRRELSPRETEFYRAHLIFGAQPDDSVQARAWRRLASVQSDDGPGWEHDFGMRDLLAMLEASDDDPDVHGALRRILVFERLAGPASRLYSHLAACHGIQLDAVVELLRQAWGEGLRTVSADAMADQLEPALEAHGQQGADRLVQLARALQTGAYREAITLLVAQNTDIMSRRRGGPWIVIGADDAIQVRYRQEPAEIPDREALATLWERTYFLNAFKRVGAVIEQAGVPTP